jgi:hypothetical protein
MLQNARLTRSSGKAKQNAAGSQSRDSPELALQEIGRCRDSKKDPIPETPSTWRCPVNGWYGLLLAILKPLGLLALAGTLARGFVAFAAWRKAFRDRLVGAEQHEHEVS